MSGTERHLIEDGPALPMVFDKRSHKPHYRFVARINFGGTRDPFWCYEFEDQFGRCYRIPVRQFWHGRDPAPPPRLLSWPESPGETWTITVGDPA